MVFLTYNPTGFSYVSWILPEGNLSSWHFGPLEALAGIGLVIAGSSLCGPPSDPWGISG